MKKLLSIALFFSFIFSIGNSLAGTVIIESWRNDDADAWNDKIIPHLMQNIQI